ncbi:hypothetical protein D910_08029, partial [Dendroctonus ponderosae]
RRLALLLVGLDNAGKTVAAKGLAGEPIDCPIPTIGFSVIELKHLQYDVKIFDLGGSSNIRAIWCKYFVDVHGVIFVVDSCDETRFHEARGVLEEILSSDKISGKPLLILANKQDQEAALDEIDLIECLHIEELVNRYECPALVQSCCANYNKIDPGIKQGYEWIVNYVDNNYELLNRRVQLDIVEQEIKEKQEMLERLRRIKLERESRLGSVDPNAIQTFSEYASQMNGDAVKDANDLQMADFYPNPEEPKASDHSTSSSITFPEVYYVNSFGAERERPQSAVQIVKRQLQMGAELRRAQSAKTRRNKTAPADPMLNREFIPRRPSRSHAFTISQPDMGPGGDCYPPAVYHGEVEARFELKKLNVKHPARFSGEDGQNGMCVVNVE